MKKIIAFNILLLLFSLGAWAQMPDFAKNPTSGSSTSAPASNSDFKIIYPDSLPVHFFYAGAPTAFYTLKDTLLDNFQQYDPARQLAYFDVITLGEVGHPTKALMYQPLIREGFDLGIHQFDLYLKTPEEVRFFKNPKPYTEAFYSQGSTQETFLMKAIGSIHLTKQIQGAVDFRRIKEAGLYENSNNKHTNFSFSAWYHSKGGRHQAYVSYLGNSILQKNNGGLEDLTDLDLGGTFGSASLVAVNLDNSQTEYYKRYVTLTNYFLLKKPNKQIEQDNPVIDSLLRFPPTQRPAPTIGIAEDKANLLVMHEISYERAIHKFFDSAPNAVGDTLIYGDFLVDNRGLRNYMDYHKVENVFKIRLDYKGQLDVGLKHKLFVVNQEPTDTVLNNLFIIGNWTLATKNERFGLAAKAHFGLLDNGGDYLVDAKAFLTLDKLGRLNARLMSQRYSPSLMQYRLYVSQQEIWRNDFAKPLETSLMLSYTLPKTQTTLHFQNHLLNNLIYYDTLGLATQASNAVNIVQVMASQNFKFGAFHADNTVGFQQISNGEVLHYPSFMSKHSLYFEGFVFKKAALARMGIDARYFSAYFADNFQPVTGQFYLQNHTNIKNKPLLDAFLSFKIQTFRAFIKAENLHEVIWGEQYTLFGKTFFVDTPTHLLYAPNYASRNLTIRLGVHWRFYD